MKQCIIVWWDEEYSCGLAIDEQGNHYFIPSSSLRVGFKDGDKITGKAQFHPAGQYLTDITRII